MLRLDNLLKNNNLEIRMYLKSDNKYVVIFYFVGFCLLFLNKELAKNDYF